MVGWSGVAAVASTHSAGTPAASTRQNVTASAAEGEGGGPATDSMLMAETSSGSGRRSALRLFREDQPAVRCHVGGVPMREREVWGGTGVRRPRTTQSVEEIW